MVDFSEWPTPAKALVGLFAAILSLVLWSILASALFLVGTGLIRGHQGVPLLEWWLYWWFYGLEKPIVGFWLKLSAGAATGIPALLMLAGVMRRGLPGIAARSLHGFTRWAKNPELRANGFRAKFGGLFVGYTGRHNYLRWGGPEHVACYAPTRSGKGVGLVIPNCLLYEATLVCLDVKKENWAASAGIRTAAGQKVHLFDPLAPDGRTARYNPLSYVRRGTIDAFDDIQRISQMLFPHAAGDQAFWTDSARSAFVGATAFLAETPEAPLTIGEVLRLLSRHDGAPYILGMIEARRIAGKPYTAATVGALSDYLSGSTDTVQGIRKTVTSKLALWFNPRIDAATSASDFDLRELRNSLHAIYVGVTPDNIERLRPLLALFFQQLVDLTVRTLPQFDPKAKHQVLVLLDEFPLLGPMPVLADAFAFVAGYNMRLMLIMQSKAQLRDPALYGPDKATAILDNCGIEVVFGTKNNDLAKELSERLGTDTVDAVSRSGPRFWRLFRGKNLNETESDRPRALLLPQEITRLRSRECIIIRPGMFPIKARRIRYFRDRTFTRLLRKPPKVEPIEVVARMDQGTAGLHQPTPAPAPAAAASPAPAAPPASPPAPAMAPPPAAPTATTVVSASSPPEAADSAGAGKGKAAKGKGKAAPVNIETVKLRISGPALAYADVQLAGVNLCGLRVTRQDGELTIHSPERTDGQGRPRPLYTLRPEWQDAIKARIAELWDQPEGDGKAGGSEAAPPAVPAGAGEPVAPAAPAPEAEAETDPMPTLSPFQANSLMAGVLGTEVDLSAYAEPESKAVVASLLGGIPTVASLDKKREVAAE